MKKQVLFQEVSRTSPFQNIQLRQCCHFFLKIYRYLSVALRVSLYLTQILIKKDADQFLVTTLDEHSRPRLIIPEYNQTLPAALKNAIEVGPRPYQQVAFSGKTAMIISQSNDRLDGFGTKHQLRQSLIFLMSLLHCKLKYFQCIFIPLLMIKAILLMHRLRNPWQKSHKLFQTLLNG